jgi:hypothetical protein
MYSGVPTLAPGQPEIQDSDVPLLVDHHVGRLQVAVDHLLRMGRLEPARDPGRDLHRLSLVKPAGLVQQLVERLAFDPLHGEKEESFTLADVVDAADVGVRDLARDPHLAAKTLDQLGLAAQVGTDQLERHRAVERGVDRLVDHAHAALTDALDDREAFGKDLSRQKVQGVRRLLIRPGRGHGRLKIRTATRTGVGSFRDQAVTFGTVLNAHGKLTGSMSAFLGDIN